MIVKTIKTKKYCQINEEQIKKDLLNTWIYCLKLRNQFHNGKISSEELIEQFALDENSKNYEIEEYIDNQEITSLSNASQALGENPDDLVQWVMNNPEYEKANYDLYWNK